MVIGMVVLSDLPVVLALFTFVLNLITVIPLVIYFVVFKFTRIVITLLVYKVTSYFSLFVASKVVTFIWYRILTNI